MSGQHLGGFGGRNQPGSYSGKLREVVVVVGVCVRECEQGGLTCSIGVMVYAAVGGCTGQPAHSADATNTVRSLLVNERSVKFLHAPK